MHILDILNDVVTACRQTGTITNILQVGNNFDVIVTEVGDVKVNDYIQINNIDCLVLSVNGFILTVKTPSDITGATTFTAKKPYFYFEKWIPTANYLSLKDNVRALSLQKYPLIFAALDLTETRDELKTITTIDNLNIYFFSPTDPVQDAAWRLDNVFKPILIPVYEKFMTELKKNFYIASEFKKLINHSYNEIYYLGTADKNQNKLNDFVDAIHINIKELKIKNLKNC